MITQEQKVLNYLKKHGSITSWEAFEHFHITRLSARIYRLRAEGHIIDTVNKTKKNEEGSVTNYAMYKLIEEAKDGG